MSRERLRLLYYVEQLGFGGANQTTITVAREMKNRGHHVVVASDGGPLAGRLSEALIPHVSVKTHVRHPSGRAGLALARAIREHAIDLVCPNGFDCTLDAIPAALLTGRPVLPTYGGLYTPPYPHPWLPRVNVFSHELAADLEQRFGWAPSVFRHVIARIDGERFHPELDGAAFRREWGFGAERQVLLMVCRQDATKLRGILVLLDAAIRIRERLPRAAIVLLGDGERRGDVLSRIGRVHEEAGEEFIAAPGSTLDTPRAFAAADLVVANGARSALEGMACGRAVISVGPNGFCGVFSPETIEGFRRFNFDKGRLDGNPLGQTDNLVRAAVEILRNDELRRELGQFNAAYARRHLVIQDSCSAYEQLYVDVLDDPWGGPRGRLRVGRDWLSVVARFYRHRLRRRFQRSRGDAPAAECDRLVPPPRGLDPEWRFGIAGDAAR